MKPLQYTSNMLTRTPPSGWDAETTLVHFAIITFMVDLVVLRTHTHARFELNCITAPDGTQKGLISVVPFIDRDFRFSRLPWSKWKFGQTNYRAYVTDSKTGEHVVWFFGTSLSSASVAIPRYAWKLPWHYNKIRFDTRYDLEQQRYKHYQMAASAGWAPAKLELEDTGKALKTLNGFPDLESGLVLLTHPTKGYYYLRDGQLGSYSIWHDKLQPTEGRAKTASFPLLQQLGLVNDGDLSAIHSVMMQPEVDFTIYLPPTAG